ncbi:MAG: hypothetical protein QOE58_2131 [Actinomycetota bacterium]|jgi:hypothetical protein|nr:hypothetical protein [Actinomycetota bacterium]
MRKRLMAAALAGVFALTGTPAHAEGYHDAIDRQPPVPCNPYPPGKKFALTAIPSSATIRKGGNIDVTAELTRGPEKTHCKRHLIILRYKSRPGSIIMTHRTGDRGTASFVVMNVRSTRSYFFDLLYNNAYTHSNVGVIRVF